MSCTAVFGHSDQVSGATAGAVCVRVCARVRTKKFSVLSVLSLVTKLSKFTPTTECCYI